MAVISAARPWSLVTVVVGALLVTVGVDVYGIAVTQSTSDALVGDALGSVAIVDDLRWQVHRLVAADTGAPVETILARIDADIDAYAPLAAANHNQALWRPLRDQLVVLREEVRRDRTTTRAAAVSALIEQLVASNLRSATGVISGLRRLRQREIVVDGVVGLVIVVIVVRVGRGFARALRRESALQAQNLALIQEQNRELEAFAGRAAHDLRAPLNPIRGFAELISTGSDSLDETRRMAGLISRGVMRMTRVIDDMLELSHSGRPQPGATSVRDAAGEVLRELEAELRDAEVRVEVDDVMVACGGTALEQILRNLLGNSAKYRSLERRLAIGMSARGVDGRVVIEVVDNGVGMDADAARHAFDPFFRARRDVAGTGLGLAIVERIARACGGSCALDSSQDQGTRITVTLPQAMG